MEIEIIQLIWDEVNVNHIWEKHQITREEVEEVVFSTERVAGQQKSRGRMITTFLSPKSEKGVFYPATARSSSVRERRIYRAQRGGVKNG